MYMILTDRSCIALLLRPGAVLRCRRGTLWLTMETRDRRQAEDVVLARGDCYRVTASGSYFVSAPGGGTAVCGIDVPTFAASLRIHSATRRTSSRGWAFAWMSQ